MAGCAVKKSTMNQGDQNTYHHAMALAQELIITDGHVDFPYHFHAHDLEPTAEHAHVPISKPNGDFDYERAKQGGLDAPFMVAFVPASYQVDLDSAKAFADSMIDMVHWMIEQHPDKFARGDSPRMIEENAKKGLISFPMGLENGAPVKTLADVGYFYKRGIRYITLTHGKDNHICDSSYDTTRTWKGLSPFGYDVVREMNKVGMIIDVSHLSDDAFYDVMESSKAPVLATHSSCRAFTPGWERNMSDEMIKLLASKGGVIQINFGSSFLDGDVKDKRESNRKELQAIAKKYAAGDPKAKEEEARYKKKHPDPFSTVEKVADHIDHVKKLVGIDYVGLGSDFDGVGDSLPTGLKDVSQYPNLINELLKRGYTEEEIAKICYQNVWRVWHKVNEIAGRS